MYVTNVPNHGPFGGLTCTPASLCLAFGLLMTAMPGPARAADMCAQWRLPATLTLIQSNNSGGDRNPRFVIKQTGPNFEGKGQYYYAHEANSLLSPLMHDDLRESSGPVVGTVVGDAFEATVYWDNKSIGVYTGQVGPQGLLVGSTFDKTDAAARADFHSDVPLQCAQSSPFPKGLGQLSPRPVGFGRLKPRQQGAVSQTSLCDAAKSAMARKSPAAPALERQCRAQQAADATAAVSQTASAGSEPSGLLAAGIPENFADARDPRQGGWFAPQVATVRPRRAGHQLGAPLPAVEQSPMDAATHKAGEVMLNPQPLPPKERHARLQERGAPAVEQSPMDAATHKAGEVMLNPQPLPPKERNAQLQERRASAVGTLDWSTPTAHSRKSIPATPIAPPIPSILPAQSAASSTAEKAGIIIVSGRDTAAIALKKPRYVRAPATVDPALIAPSK